MSSVSTGPPCPKIRSRGLLWFLKGANSVVIPRGVFYGSKMYASLDGSWSGFNTTDQPLKGAVVNGSSNALSSNLNSRVIQMVIAKNLTSHKRGDPRPREDELNRQRHRVPVLCDLGVLHPRVRVGGLNASGK